MRDPALAQIIEDTPSTAHLLHAMSVARNETPPFQQPNPTNPYDPLHRTQQGDTNG